MMRYITRNDREQLIKEVLCSNKNLKVYGKNCAILVAIILNIGLISLKSRLESNRKFIGNIEKTIRT